MSAAALVSPVEEEIGLRTRGQCPIVLRVCDLRIGKDRFRHAARFGTVACQEREARPVDRRIIVSLSLVNSPVDPRRLAQRSPPLLAAKFQRPVLGKARFESKHMPFARMVEPPFPEQPRRAFGRTGAGKRQHTAMLEYLLVRMTAEVLARAIEREEQIPLLEQPLDLGNGFRRAFRHHF